MSDNALVSESSIAFQRKNVADFFLRSTQTSQTAPRTQVTSLCSGVPPRWACIPRIVPLIAVLEKLTCRMFDGQPGGKNSSWLKIFRKGTPGVFMFEPAYCEDPVNRCFSRRKFTSALDRECTYRHFSLSNALISSRQSSAAAVPE